MYFSSLLTVGKSGFSFFYRSSTAAVNNLLPRYELSRFPHIEIDEPIIRVLIPVVNKVRTVPRVDCHPTTEDTPTSIFSMIHGPSRQASIYVVENPRRGSRTTKFHSVFARCSFRTKSISSLLTVRNSLNHLKKPAPIENGRPLLTVIFPEEKLAIPVDRSTTL